MEHKNHADSEKITMSLNLLKKREKANLSMLSYKTEVKESS